MKGFEEEKAESDIIFEDDEEIEYPKFIESQGIVHDKKIYTLDYRLKDIKRIYKRIINPRNPGFVDIIKCDAVEIISKMRINFLYKFLL